MSNIILHHGIIKQTKKRKRKKRKRERCIARCRLETMISTLRRAFPSAQTAQTPHHHTGSRLFLPFSLLPGLPLSQSTCHTAPRTVSDIEGTSGSPTPCPSSPGSSSLGLFLVFTPIKNKKEERESMMQDYYFRFLTIIIIYFLFC